MVLTDQPALLCKAYGLIKGLPRRSHCSSISGFNAIISHHNQQQLFLFVDAIGK